MSQIYKEFEEFFKFNCRKKPALKMDKELK
jgi:hypothetical protein